MFSFARYSPQCESSIIFATPHERPRMLTNTYEYLAIILRSLRLVANCIRKPIRHIFATIWRICREYILLHSQGYSPQCETSITNVLSCISLLHCLHPHIQACWHGPPSSFYKSHNVVSLTSVCNELVCHFENKLARIRSTFENNLINYPKIYQIQISTRPRLQ